MASQPSRPRRNVSPASSSKPQPLRAVHHFSLLRNPSPTRGNPIRRSPSSSPVHNTENAFKPRRNSPETRGSPEHRRSPTSPSLASLKGNIKALVIYPNTIQLMFAFLRLKTYTKRLLEITRVAILWGLFMRRTGKISGLENVSLSLRTSFASSLCELLLYLYECCC